MMTIEFYRLLHKNSSTDVKVHFWHFGRFKRSPRAKVMNWLWLISLFIFQFFPNFFYNIFLPFIFVILVLIFLNFFPSGLNILSLILHEKSIFVFKVENLLKIAKNVDIYKT